MGACGFLPDGEVGVFAGVFGWGDRADAVVVVGLAGGFAGLGGACLGEGVNGRR